MAELIKLKSAARTSEVNSVTSGMISEYSKKDWSSDAYLTNLFTELQMLDANLTVAVNRIKAESDLEDKDATRDELIRSINYVILGFLHSPDPTFKSAAEKVYSVFEHYGFNITTENYESESTLVKSLLLDLSKEELQSSIAVLPSLGTSISRLRSAQTEFEVAQLVFQNEKAAQGNLESASEIKKKIIPLINEKLFFYLRAMNLADPAKYCEFTSNITQIIVDVNQKVKVRTKPGAATTTKNE